MSFFNALPGNKIMNYHLKAEKAYACLFIVTVEWLAPCCVSPLKNQTWSQKKMKRQMMGIALGL